MFDFCLHSKQQAATDAKTSEKTEAAAVPATPSEEKPNAAPSSAGLNGPKAVLESVTNPTDKDDKVQLSVFLKHSL